MNSKGTKTDKCRQTQAFEEEKDVIRKRNDKNWKEK